MNPANFYTERHFKNEDEIKSKIVECYRRGVCDHEGRHIPEEHRGMAGKGSHFSPHRPTTKYEENYVKIFGHD